MKACKETLRKMSNTATFVVSLSSTFVREGIPETVDCARSPARLVSHLNNFTCSPPQAQIGTREIALLRGKFVQQRSYFAPSVYHSRRTLRSEVPLQETTSLHTPRSWPISVFESGRRDQWCSQESRRCRGPPPPSLVRSR